MNNDGRSMNKGSSRKLRMPSLYTGMLPWKILLMENWIHIMTIAEVVVYSHPCMHACIQKGKF
jgi:hypothetical protein